MRTGEIAFLAAFLAPFAAFAVNEGVPSYYQTAPTTTANSAAYGQYANMGYTQYVGQSGQKQSVSTNSYTYQVPRVKVPTISNAPSAYYSGYNANGMATTKYLGYGTNSAMTANGISIPVEN